MFKALANIRERANVGRMAAKGLTFNGPASSWDYGWRWGGNQSAYDYAGAVGDLSTNATAAICIAWMQRTLTEVPFVVQAQDGDEFDPVPNHPLTKLMNRPAPHWTRQRLMSAAIHSLMGRGNAFIHKSRNNGKVVKELHWLPPHTIRVVPHRTNFISHYEYQPSGAVKQEIPVEDMIHLRFGVNPYEPWNGVTPWFYMLAEFSTDNQGSIYSEAILRNGGAVAGVASPKHPDAELSQADASLIKSLLENATQGHKAGSWVVPHGAIEIMKLGYSPEELTLDKLRTYPQDMIASAVGLSTLLLDLPSGKDTRTFANKAEAREAAVEQNVIPSLSQIAEEFDVQLLPEFDEDESHRCAFDVQKMRILQPDLDKQYERQTKAVGGPWLSPNEARSMVGLLPIEGGDVLYTGGGPSEPEEGEEDEDMDGEEDLLRQLNGNGNAPGGTGRGKSLGKPVVKKAPHPFKAEYRAWVQEDRLRCEREGIEHPEGVPFLEEDRQE